MRHALRIWSAGLALTLVLPAVLAARQSAWSDSAAIASPDGQLEAEIGRLPEGGLRYRVSFRGRPVVEPSILGLQLEQGALGARARWLGVERSSGVERYSLPHGKVAEVREAWNGLRLRAAETAGAGEIPFEIELRVFDDAVAFRYVLGEELGPAPLALAGESTTFEFAGDAMTWAMALPSYTSMYENEFVARPLSALANQGGSQGRLLLGLPVLLELPGVAWAAVVEADLRDTSALYLRGGEDGWTSRSLIAQLAPRHDEPDVAVRASLPWCSAWRVLLLADDPGGLIESTVVQSLSPPSRIEDPSWIRPGKAAWNWWSGSIGPEGSPDFSTEGLLHYVDFAAELGLEYVIVDAGWSPYDDLLRLSGRVDVEAVIRAADERGIGVWLWAHYAALDRQMEEAFALFAGWGVAGVKVDFVARDDQVGIDFYHRSAEAAARHRLLIDYHGSTKPSGLERTWPNVLGYEAVLGLEQSKAGARDEPGHRVTLAFTRMLLGQMDFTPGGFRHATRETFEPRMTLPVVLGTRAHHLAQYVVYDAPLQTVADHPDAVRGQVGAELLQDVPTRWDETRWLAGRPGEYVLIARRSGEQWFVGALNGWQARTIELRLDFLGQDGQRALIFRDTARSAEQPADVERVTVDVDRDDTLRLDLAPGGGAVLRLGPRSEVGYEATRSRGEPPAASAPAS